MSSRKLVLDPAPLYASGLDVHNSAPTVKAWMPAKSTSAQLVEELSEEMYPVRSPLVNAPDGETTTESTPDEQIPETTCAAQLDAPMSALAEEQ